MQFGQQYQHNYNLFCCFNILVVLVDVQMCSEYFILKSTDENKWKKNDKLASM